MESVPAQPSAGPATSPTSPPPIVRLLRTSPEKGPVGTNITLFGEGLPPGKEAEVMWATVDGRYEVSEAKAAANLGLEYRGRVFTPKRVKVATAHIGPDGTVAATFRSPEDYGEIHDIYLVADGQDVAKGGYRLLRSFTMTPTEGAVGTAITLKVTGLGWKPEESTVAVSYDNKYTGFVSATTTRGTAVARFRAAGPPGKHYISVDPASHAEPFLNIATGGESTRRLLPFEQTFTVTGDEGPPLAATEWPDPARVVSANSLSSVPSMGELANTPGIVAEVTPNHGPTAGKATLRASGLPAGIVDVTWVVTRPADALGVRPAPTDGVRLSTATADRNGRVEVSVTVPPGIGGWHVIQLVQKGKILAETPFYVEQSLSLPVPVRVKAGEKFSISFTGGGWTELDNGAAVTYDNAYTGYVCGFANNGDTPVELTATGGPGTHLIDIYPYIFGGGHGDFPWQYNLPQLTALQDHPGLGLGYRLPIYRLAIQIVD